MFRCVTERRQSDLQVIAAAEVGHLERYHEAVHRVFHAHLLRYPQIDLEVLRQSRQRRH